MTDDEKRTEYILRLQRSNRALHRKVRALEEKIRTMHDEQSRRLVKVGALKGVRSVGSPDGAADAAGVGVEVHGDGGERVYRTDPLLDASGLSGDSSEGDAEADPSLVAGGDGVRDG